MALPNAHFATVAIHGRQCSQEEEKDPLLPDITCSTTYKRSTQTNINPQGFYYIRGGNPSRTALEENLAALENGKYGLCFSSGLAAVDCLFHLLEVGDHLIYSKELYIGTKVLFSEIFTKKGLETTEVDPTHSNNFRAALKCNTKMIWLESPSNPHLVLVDIAAVVDIARTQPGILVVVDNTFMTPYFQNPLRFGADVVMHSATKYLGGHSDVLMGAIITSNDSLHQKLRFLQEGLGAVPSPYDCYMVHRGIKTLHLRMQEHSNNSLAVAQFLEKHPLIEKVIHPGLSSHPQHALALRQSHGHSGMVTVLVKGGADDALRLVRHLQLFTFATSLGGTESLILHLASTVFAHYTEEERIKRGITDNLLRISVGIEDINDLLRDLDQALWAASKHQ